MEASNKSEKEETAKTISDAFNMLYNTGVHGHHEAFDLELDRQIRPTIVAVTKYAGKDPENRQDVKTEVFIAMMKTLIDAIDNLIPEHRNNVYFTYSYGSWKRTKAFHIKAHLTTKDFLILLENLYKKKECPKDQKNEYDHKKSLKEILENRFKGDHHGDKLREHAGIDLKERTEVSENFCVTFTKDLDYPFLGLYNTSQSAVIQIQSLAEGLSFLETVVTSKFFAAKIPQDAEESKGYAIGMVLAPVSSTPESRYSVYAAAIVYEPSYNAICVKKGEKEVKASWRTEDRDGSQKSDDFLVQSLASPLAISSYWSYIQKMEKEWQEKKQKKWQAQPKSTGFTWSHKK